MSWQGMAPHTRTFQQTPSVSIGSGGALYLNTFAMINYFKEIEAVAILYDPIASKLGIQAASPNDMDVFRLGFSNKSATTGVISARSVVKRLSLPYDKATLIFDEVKWDSKARILEVNLKSYKERKRD